MKLASLDNIAMSAKHFAAMEIQLRVNVKSFITKERITFVGNAAIRCALRLSAHNKLVIVWLAGHLLFIALALRRVAPSGPEQ